VTASSLFASNIKGLRTILTPLQSMNSISILFVAFVLAVGGSLLVYPTSPTLAQMDNTTSSNDTMVSSTTNATGGANATLSQDNSTFTANGSIAGLIFGSGETSTSGTDDSIAGEMGISVNNETGVSENGTDVVATSNRSTGDMPYIIAGNWNLGVADGNVTGLDAEFTMVHTDGTGRHTHQLMNFVAANGTLVQLDENGSGAIFGTVDVSLNGSEKWSDANVVVMIERSSAIMISLDSNATDTHFQGQPIYGVVDSWVDVNGRELINDAREAGVTAGETVSDTGENITESAEQVGNQTGQVVENVTNTTGNIIEDLGDRVTDLFNGTDN
jgi:hypothetical protein